MRQIKKLLVIFPEYYHFLAKLLQAIQKKILMINSGIIYSSNIKVCRLYYISTYLNSEWIFSFTIKYSAILHLDMVNFINLRHISWQSLEHRQGEFRKICHFCICKSIAWIMTNRDCSWWILDSIRFLGQS